MLFFELLQVSLGNQNKLSSIPSDKEWAILYAESERQAVTGILLHGVDRLPVEQRPSQAILLQWIGVGQLIEQRNHLMDERCLELLTKLKEVGLTATILKGQGIAQLYNKGLRPLRQSGDIDVYVDCTIAEAIELAKQFGQKEINWDYQHLHLNIWEDVEIEVHYRVEVLFNLFRNRKLQKWLKVNKYQLYYEDSGITAPTVSMNIVYVLLHIYRHYLTEGVGIRQLVDYYFVLQKANGGFDVYADGKNLEDTLKSFGVYRFTQGLMWVLEEVCGLERRLMICEPLAKEGRLMLQEVMAGGNFGHYDVRLSHGKGKLSTLMDVLRHNLRLFHSYPCDTIWASTWLFWHKLWKLLMSLYLKIKP